MVKQRGKATKPFDTNHTSASVARKSKPARRTEEGLRARKESDRLRVKTRINISYSFTRWRRFKEEKKLRTDADVANYLLNFFEEIEVTIDDDECNSVKSRLSDLDSDLEHAPGAIDNCDEDVHVPIIPQSSTTSELLLECEEEELEPWQQHTLLVHLKKEEEARELSM
ncbi:uncharacterized protein LOC119199256 isoform X2 [Pungitius pungitius]|uniref:uncharacterized protein LOC119199256 isoform X2 n=1 Tax=Pungitius pungitius TaxID=134920 RepID=UPI002E0ED4B1